MRCVQSLCGLGFLLCAALVFGFGLYAHPSGAAPIAWVTVGDPGNAADDTGFGAVPYVYRVSKYEITNARYVEFLNAVDPTGLNPNAVYHTSMGSAGHGGISFNAGGANGRESASTFSDIESTWNGSF